VKHGDISNKPALALVIGLEEFSTTKISRFQKKLTLEFPNAYPIVRMNDMFLHHDIQIVITAVLPKKYQAVIEEYLDDVGLLYKEVILEDTEEELQETMKRERLQKPEPYYYDALWT